MPSSSSSSGFVPSSVPISKPHSSSSSSAAVLSGLCGPAATVGVGDDDDSSQSQPINQLHAQMSMLMHRPGGGPKLTMLRRAGAGGPSSTAAAASATMGRSAEAEQKTAEQREREYEETRAAIFGGQIDGLRSTASTVTSILPAPSVDTDPSDSSVDAAVQPSAAALAEVHHHHSKRNEKSKQLQNKHRQGGHRNHRIIDDLVGNRTNSSTSNQTNRMEQHDPDFNRSTRQLYQPPTNSYYPSVSPSPSPLLPYPSTAAYSTGPAAGGHFAQGPIPDRIGFGRIRTSNNMNTSNNNNVTANSNSTTTTSQVRFNPNAATFVPTSNFATASASTSTPAPAPYATPNVYMGSQQHQYAPPTAAQSASIPILRPNYDNYYLSQEHQHQRVGGSYGVPSQSQHASAPIPPTAADFPALGSTNAQTTTTTAKTNAPAGQWKHTS